MTEETPRVGAPLPKLVRDGVPDLIVADGRSPQVRTLDQAEFVDALRGKLVEEAAEASQARERPALIAELADLAEVVDALSSALGIPREEIEAQRRSLRDERGGFERRFLLEGTRVPPAGEAPVPR